MSTFCNYCQGGFLNWQRDHVCMSTKGWLGSTNKNISTLNTQKVVLGQIPLLSRSETILMSYAFIELVFEEYKHSPVCSGGRKTEAV